MRERIDAVLRLARDERAARRAEQGRCGEAYTENFEQKGLRAPQLAVAAADEDAAFGNVLPHGDELIVRLSRRAVGLHLGTLKRDPALAKGMSRTFPAT